MTDEEKKEQEDSLQVSLPFGKLNLTGDNIKMLIPYVGKALLIATGSYVITSIIGALR